VDAGTPLQGPNQKDRRTSLLPKTVTGDTDVSDDRGSYDRYPSKALSIGHKRCPGTNQVVRSDQKLQFPLMVAGESGSTDILISGVRRQGTTHCGQTATYFGWGEWMD